MTALEAGPSVAGSMVAISAVTPRWSLVSTCFGGFVWALMLGTIVLFSTVLVALQDVFDVVLSALGNLIILCDLN